MPKADLKRNIYFMDLNLVSQILRKTIRERGKVSLPLMGSLELADVPAGFVQNGSVMTPPSRKIVFNGFDVANDGVLEKEYADAAGITLEESKKEVADFVGAMKSGLIDSNEFEIKGFGKIFFGADFKYDFRADENFYLSPDSFGLDEIKVERNPDKESVEINEIASESEGTEDSKSEVEVDNAKLVGSSERENCQNDRIVDVGIPEHKPEFAKSRPAIDYDFGNSVADEKNIADTAENTEGEGSVEGTLDNMAEGPAGSSVADIYKVAPAAIAPAAKSVDDTMKGTIIVESSRDERDVNNEEVVKPQKKEAEILHFKKKDESSKTAEDTEQSERFTPSAGVLGGHSYVFGKPLQSEATEVVVLGDNGKYEVEHSAVEDNASKIEKEPGAKKSAVTGVAQSALGALEVDNKPQNVNDVEVNVVTNALSGGDKSDHGSKSDNEQLTPEQLALKKNIEAQQIAESEKRAEAKIWEAAQLAQQRKQAEEEARAEAARIEAEKKAAEELAARRRRGEIVDDIAVELGADGKPRAKVVKDIEGQDESAKETIAEIFTTVAEKEAHNSGAEVVGEKESSKDWNAVNVASETSDDFAAEEAKERENILNAEKLARENEEKAKAQAKAKEKAEAWAKKQREEEDRLRAERKARNMKILKYAKYFGYGVAAVLVLALIVYALREPLRPVLEHLLYNADELRVIHYNL